MHTFRIGMLGVCLGAGTLTLFGCGGGSPAGEIERTVPVRGVLTYRGEPLEYHQVMLYQEGHRPAAGTADEQGRFILGSNSATDGAVAGKHSVSVIYVGPPRGPEYGMDDFSPPPPPKVKIPEKYATPETSELVVEIPASGSQDLKIELQ